MINYISIWIKRRVKLIVINTIWIQFRIGRSRILIFSCNSTQNRCLPLPAKSLWSLARHNIQQDYINPNIHQWLRLKSVQKCSPNKKQKKNVAGEHEKNAWTCWINSRQSTLPSRGPRPNCHILLTLCNRGIKTQSVLLRGLIWSLHNFWTIFRHLVSQYILVTYDWPWSNCVHAG